MRASLSLCLLSLSLCLLSDARVHQRARSTKTKIQDLKESREREKEAAPLLAQRESERQRVEEDRAARQRDEYRQAKDSAVTQPVRKLQEAGAEGAGLDNTDGDEWNEANVDLLNTGEDGWEAAQQRTAAYGADGFSWYEIAREELYSQAPAEIARVENLALAQFLVDPPPGYHHCACHRNPYMLYRGSECFDPWHLAVLPSCPRLCSCHGHDFEISTAIGLCVNTTVAEAANVSLADEADAATLRGFADTAETCVSGAQAQCIDDVNWSDQDGDGCVAYATFANPQVACNYEGYTEALTRCPVTCGSCELLGLSNGTATRIDRSLYTRMFSAFVNKRSTCARRNNLGTAENEFLAPRIRVSGPKSVEKCASACFEYVVDGVHACKSFAIGSIPPASGEGEAVAVCEFSDGCEDSDELVTGPVDEPWVTYLLATSAHPCDPTPTSPLVEDECGVCGGDGSTCRATLEILAEEPLEEPAPPLGSIVANGKFMFGDMRRVEHAVNCTRFPFAVACREGYKTEEEVLATLPQVAQREGKYSTVYMYLRLTGSKGASSTTLLSKARPDLLFGFGSHPGGQVANFTMAFPHGDDLGVITRAQLFLIGGDHWLAGKHAKRFRGLRLQMTINLRRLEWLFTLQQPLELDPEKDVLTIVDWQFADRAQLPVGVQRCYMDCSRDTGYGTPYSQNDPAQTGAEAPTFHSASTPRVNPKYDSIHRSSHFARSRSVDQSALRTLRSCAAQVRGRAERSRFEHRPLAGQLVPGTSLSGSGSVCVSLCLSLSLSVSVCLCPPTHTRTHFFPPHSFARTQLTIRPCAGQGCQRICSKSYELDAPQVWPHGAANRRTVTECVPAFHAVCPVFSDPGSPSPHTHPSICLCLCLSLSVSVCLPLSLSLSLPPSLPLPLPLALALSVSGSLRALYSVWRGRAHLPE